MGESNGAGVRRGTIIGERYRVDGELGAGGMSSVFAGHDTVLDRAVALKLLRHPAHGGTERLLREAQLTARVVHAACVQVFDGGVDPTVGAFIVMERLQGEDLARFLRGRGPLPVALALGLIEQLAAIVHAVHEAGVVHRDLKPGNVFVLPHPPGGVPRIKLLDFGIAQSDDGARAQLSAPGDVLGTLPYMSPERWLSPASADVRSDVYALGAILHEMLSGEPPFRGHTKAALRLAVLNDPAPSLNARRPDVPPWLASAIESALGKAPTERFADVPTFARALGLRGAAEGPPSGAPESPFRGTARYRVERRLSRGANAEVYAARDVELNRAVALERLPVAPGEAGSRLRREFRGLADLHHPNLVRLEALWEERGELLMTTELVEGEGLLEHVGGAPESARACMEQLARGLEALHAQGFAHGDVTLENLVVEPSGRLVLLGGGLATRWQDAGARVRGAGAYLSPEARHRRVGPEADLFAVGIILREALTRTRGRDAEDPLATSVPLELPPTAPADLRALCERLLAAEPAARPRAADVVAALAAPRGAPAPAPNPTRDLLVGRDDALEALEGALAALAVGEPQAIWVEGESGIGKSAVLEHFRRRLARRAQTVVLAGRARRGDAVPFPALDEAIDDLGAYLERLPPSTAEVLVPRRASHLARLFPSLTSVLSVGRDAREPDATEGAAETRRRAFDGLRDLLARLAESRTVVVVLDDLQWIDADSRALLAHLLDGPRAPALLVVGGVRTTEDSDELRKLDASLGPRVRRLALGPLSHDESCQLVRARWRGRAALDPAVAARLAAEAQGVPFFLEMLAATPEIEGLPRLESGGGLEEVLAARIRMLSPLARRALEIVCLASRPLPVEIVLEASGHRDLREIDALLRAPFLRSTRAERGWLLEPHHDRLRDAVCGALGEADARAHHRALASALEREPSSEAELFIEHLAAGGDARRATEVARSAARAANEHLAFERAAALFAVALEHGGFDEGSNEGFNEDERLSLVRERARALQLARRRRQCGEVLLDASARSSREPTASALREEAGVHLLYAGDVLRGLEALEPALARAGLRVPTTFDETLGATMAALGALGAAMSAPARPGPREPAPEAEARVDLCLVLAQGLAHIDLRVLPFACQGLVAALEAGDPRRLQRATALFVINTVEYLPNPFVAPALALCRTLTEADATPYARALLDAAVAENAHFEGDFLEAEAAFERAEHTLLDLCPEATRELATVRDLAVFVQYAQKGDFKTQLARTQRWLAEADAARDVYHASMLRVAHAIVWIAQDDPARARAELRRAQEQWIGEAGVLEVGAALYHDIIDRYEELDLAPGEPGPQSVLLRSPAAQTPFLGGYIGLQRAWKALRAIAAGRGDEREATALVTEVVVGLRASGLTIWAAVSDVLEANLRYLGGEHERAARGLDAAETTFKRMGMACLASCARRRRGEFIEGELGARLRAEADAELHRLGVVDVTRWTRAYWSMFDAQGARARTADGAPLTASESPAA